MTDQVECNCAWNSDRHADTCPVYMQQRIESLRAEIEELDALRNRQSDLLSQTAIALRGPEPALTRYSHADIPSRVKTVVADLEVARGLLSGLISAVRSINCTPRHAIMIKGDDEPCFWQRREWVEYVLGLCTEAEAALTATTAQEVQRCPKCESDTAIETRRLDGIEAVALQRILFENHRDARPADVGLMGWAAAVLAKKTQQQEAVHWRAVLSPAEVPRQLNIHEHVVGFTDRRKAEDWIAARLHMDGWHYTLEALYPGPQPAQVNRIPAGLYAELEALRTLRDATGVYLQGYMLDEIEDEESCSADQHDAACSVKSALDKARALEWKGGGEEHSHG